MAKVSGSVKGALPQGIRSKDLTGLSATAVRERHARSFQIRTVTKRPKSVISCASVPSIDPNLFLGPLILVPDSTTVSEFDRVLCRVFQSIGRMDVDLSRRNILVPQRVPHLLNGGTVL